MTGFLIELAFLDGRERLAGYDVAALLTDDAELATLRGQRVDPDSGDAGYDGVQAASNPDPFYFRPDNDAPRHPGARSPAIRSPAHPSQSGGVGHDSGRPAARPRPPASVAR